MVRLIPREVLFGNPERTGPELSPDGTELAWIAPHAGVLNVWTMPLRSAADQEAGSKARLLTCDAHRGIRAVDWAPDGKHLLFLQDSEGDENWHLYAVDRSTGHQRDLTPLDGVQVKVIALRKRCPTQMLVGLNRDNPRLHDVYRLDLLDGKLTKEVENPGFVQWLADDNLAIRAGFSPKPDGGFDLMVQKRTGIGWSRLLAIPADDALTTDVVCFSEDGNSLLAVSSLGADTGRLVRIDLATARTTVLAEDPGADVQHVLVHPLTREPEIVTFLKDRAAYRVLDPLLEPDLDAIRGLHPGDPVFCGSDAAHAIWLVAFTNDAGPVPYFAYDRASRTGRFLFENRPALAGYPLASMEPFRFAARDGLTIHGYATFPPGADRRGLATVLNVHGGPQARDSWGFNREAQWLANRGYLCIQVNFRGSTGSGKAFINAGDREWGGKMHDDLVDAVNFTTSQGWTDPRRVAIYGGSYGGYAALVGATFTPELFCCAIAIDAPSNLAAMIEAIPAYWTPVVSMLHKRVGNPAHDAEFLWSRSPLSRVRDIKVPLLIAQGANDPRVRQAESEQFVMALREAGIDHEYLLFSDEGHGFARPENRARFYRAAEKFLARHLGGRVED
jgi:dipeptidyl aminopeptidase/acylaminoacyl peptidase